MMKQADIQINVTFNPEVKATITYSVSAYKYNITMIVQVFFFTWPIKYVNSGNDLCLVYGMKLKVSHTKDVIPTTEWCLYSYTTWL